MGTPIKLPLFSSSGEAAGEVDAPDSFDGVPHRHVMYLAVIKQLANKRAGNASTKTKGEVRGGGKKPWKQKHTGRARQGSIRNPHWRGGGVSFGPRPRSYEQELSVKVRRLALKSAVVEKIREGQMVVLESLDRERTKTKEGRAFLAKLPGGPRTVLVVVSREAGIDRPFRNLGNVLVGTAASVSAYDVLNARRLVVSKDALELLARRCGSVTS